MVSQEVAKKPMSIELPYKEGDWFAVPLRDGGFAVGLVARARRQGKILFGYFFGPRRASPPSLDELAGLSPKDALRALCFGDLGMIEQKWPIIGQLPCWSREEWPMQDFVRRDEISGRAWRVRYSDVDPSEVIAEEAISSENAELENDGLFGYGAVELLLTHLLSK